VWDWALRALRVRACGTDAMTLRTCVMLNFELEVRGQPARRSIAIPAQQGSRAVCMRWRAQFHCRRDGGDVPGCDALECGSEARMSRTRDLCAHHTGPQVRVSPFVGGPGASIKSHKCLAGYDMAIRESDGRSEVGSMITSLGTCANARLICVPRRGLTRACGPI